MCIRTYKRLHVYKYTRIAAVIRNPRSLVVLKRFAAFPPASPPGLLPVTHNRVFHAPETPRPQMGGKRVRARLNGLLCPPGSGAGAFRGGTPPPPGSGAAGRGGTGLTEHLYLRACSSFPNQAAAEPWRSTAGAAESGGVPLGRAPSLPAGAVPALPVSPGLERVPFPFEHCVSRGVAGAAVGRGCRGRRALAGRSRGWRPASLAGPWHWGGFMVGAAPVLAVRSRG